MRISACSIMGFGKFQRYSLSFGEHLHVIYGENEAGKTTLKNYLVSMMFGISKKRGSASKKDDYHKYLPYMGGIYGGSIEIEYQGRFYQIQRNFSESRDITVYDVRTGKKVLEGIEPSEGLFQMTKEGFLQTLCVSQGAIETGKELTLMLRNYLANMSQTKTQDVNVEKALSWLRKEARKEKRHPAYQELSRMREAGEKVRSEQIQIEKLEKQRDELEAKLESEEEKKGILQRILDWIRRLFGFADPQELKRQEWNYQLEVLEVRLETLYEKQEQAESFELRMKELKDQIRGTERNILAIHKAMDAITEASEEIHQTFGSGLEERVSQLVKTITNGAYEKIRIDDAMGIVVEKDGTFLDINYLSTGTVEQIYLAVRLAAAELMFPEEEFPLIMDDVFGNFDDERLMRVLKLLDEEQRQVILFSCRKDVLDLLDQEGIRYEKTVLI